MTQDEALRIDSDDRLLIRSCINESLEIVDPTLFALKTGRDREAAITLHAQLADGGRGTISMPADAVELAEKCVTVPLELVDSQEFQSRTGYETVDAERLRDCLNGALEDIDAESTEPGETPS